MLSQVQLRVSHVAAGIVDVSYPIARVRLLRYVRQVIVRQSQCQVYKSRATDGVSLISNKILMESPVATVRQHRGDAFALSVQSAHVKLHTLLYQALAGILLLHDPGYGAIANVVVHVIDKVRLARLQHIGQVHLLAVVLHLAPHLCVQESRVSQLLFQVAHGTLRYRAVVYHRFLAYRLQEAVHPLRRVTS